MPSEPFSSPISSFPSSRDTAFAQLEDFLPRVQCYVRERNHVVPDHSNVSRLSPAIRHRLITEEEVIAGALDHFPLSRVEKFVQEVSWRLYWKGWLSLRPQVWTGYLEDLRRYQTEPALADIRERAEACAAGDGPIEIMNHFAKELVTTGYLHNHARMWFAGWWIHVEKLPWCLGADFFFRHLLDGDPASNTLSWRWVAGLQTRGKTYLPRRSNLERYVADEILQEHAGGLDLLENPQALHPDDSEMPEITQDERSQEPALHAEKIGIWIHEEDLLPEVGPLASLAPSSVLIAPDRASWKELRYSKAKQAWLQEALLDTCRRTQKHFGQSTEFEEAQGLESPLADWAKRYGLRQVVAARPEVGPLADRVTKLRHLLREVGTELVLLEPRAIEIRDLATGGFFSFWKKFRRLDLVAKPP